MAAYIVAQVKVSDWDRYRQYMAHTPAVIAAHGGRFLVRGGAAETLEGEAGEARIVILEFPDVAAARGFYASADYQAVKALREGAGEGSFTLVDGYAEADWAAALAASRALGPPGPPAAAKVG